MSEATGDWRTPPQRKNLSPREISNQNFFLERNQMFGRLTIPQVIARSRAATYSYNPNLKPTSKPSTATTPPVADPAQTERDWYFEQLLAECRAGHIRPTRIDWLLAESGRTHEQLDDAIERQEITERASATSPTAKLAPVCFKKEFPMSPAEHIQIKRDWDAAIAAKKVQKPHLPMSQIVTAVCRENPTLHERYVHAANS